MAIKKPQSNFTTAEQSKRLLDLGLPANSADCYHNRIAEKPYILSMPYSYSNWDNKDNPPLPCWSVGRLIEIYEICFGGYFNSRYFGHTLMEDVLLKIEEQIDSIDFLKLEE